MSQHSCGKIRIEGTVKNALKNRVTIELALILASFSLPSHAQNDPRQAAFLLERQGKTTEAESAWRTLSRAYPRNPEPFAHMGLLEARQEHYAEAIAFYRKALVLNPSMPGLQFNLGLAYFKAGEYKNALQIFKPLLNAQQPTSDEAQQLNILVGMSHYGLAEYAAASPYLKQASDRDTQNLTLLLTLAHTCLFSKQFPCVQDAYHRIVAMNAESAEADMLIGEALDAMKDQVGAQREFRAAVKANPQEPNVHFGLGYLLWTKGQYPEAAQEFQAEIDNNPLHLQALLYLADSEVQMNRMNEARPLLEKLVKSTPDNSMGHLDLGIVYTDEGRKDEALSELLLAARLEPDNVNIHWRLGRLYRSMGKVAEAKTEFDKANSLNKVADEQLLKVMSKIPLYNQNPQRGIDTPTGK
jgi:tetratricopeptide (TPR) repeat protein